MDYSLLATCILFFTQQCSDLSKFNFILKSPTIAQLEHVNQMWFEVYFCLFLSKTNINIPNCITIYCTTTCNKISGLHCVYKYIPCTYKYIYIYSSFRITTASRTHTGGVPAVRLKYNNVHFTIDNS